MTCPVCQSKAATKLGTLGNLTHLRCRDCGMDYSVSPDWPGIRFVDLVEDDEEEEEDV